MEIEIVDTPANHHCLWPECDGGRIPRIFCCVPSKTQARMLPKQGLPYVSRRAAIYRNLTQQHRAHVLSFLCHHWQNTLEPMVNVFSIKKTPIPTSPPPTMWENIFTGTIFLFNTSKQVIIPSCQAVPSIYFRGNNRINVSFFFTHHLSPSLYSLFQEYFTRQQ
jgi:hypothetical protein